jgi:hypothetical protein
MVVKADEDEEEFNDELEPEAMLLERNSQREDRFRNVAASK